MTETKREAYRRGLEDAAQAVDDMIGDRANPDEAACLFDATEKICALAAREPEASRSREIIFEVTPCPEGVWLATSQDVPGLVVEEATREQAIATAREIAPDLLAMNAPDGEGE